MRIESKKENYEMAASIRDRIKALTKISNENHSDLNNSENFDVICCIKKYEQFCIQIFFFRSVTLFQNLKFYAHALLPLAFYFFYLMFFL